MAEPTASDVSAPSATTNITAEEIIEQAEDVENPQTALIQASSTDPDNAVVATADGDAAQKKTKKIIRRKRRPARVQVDPSTIKSEPPPQTGTIFNIWYNKWSGGDREDKYLSKTAAAGRCNILKDSGYTRADKAPGSYFCMFFARGVCPNGSECEYLHRLPTIHDIYNPNVDCFGRDKFSDYRDDMGGVGSFMRQNRTIYVGRIHVTDDIEEIVARHFQEWGQVDRIRVLTARGVAFVTYSNEANAQFAKEAMAHQSLDHNEILNVRWATVDPNPLAQKREAQRLEEQAAEAVRRALPAEFVAELEGRDPEAKKRKKIEGSFGLDGYEPSDEIWYARTKEIENSERLQIEGSGHQQHVLEDTQAQASTDTPISQQPAAQQPSGGILSSSTIAALKGFSTVAKPTATGLGGSLVAYGSDDDSE
ncbi:putative cell cycle control protein [Talaromyces proteolyticus]|uniref:Pre-mRNA-splicing factor CWC2 n=1 Tax=Talaromyces proteolyticus TaxID=1131652 RepID=A0AAD4KZC7_9EURO|nr:putative cell cycle control protein [Talaromyces proteolyticus]KAH8702543.1 putative cell cycle control protein [Talaromyces proteolyticus]